MKSSIELSQMDCYAGKWRAEIMFNTPFLDDEKTIEGHEKPGLYLQFVEGCGYTVFDLMPDEAEKLADMLKAAAKATRKAFQ